VAARPSCSTRTSYRSLDSWARSFAQAEVIDDEQIGGEPGAQLALDGVVGARLPQGLQELGDLDEAHAVPSSTRRLRQMPPARVATTADPAPAFAAIHPRLENCHLIVLSHRSGSVYGHGMLPCRSYAVSISGH
jgi:hypothetical protein